MTSTWTHQQIAQSCPRRFYFRYLEPSGLARGLQHLKSIREAGGFFIHQAISEVITSVAEGGRVSDFSEAPKLALRRFVELVESCRRSPAWELTKGMQLAELFHGIDGEEEISHWQTLVPRCTENALRVLHTLGLRSCSTHYRIRPETEFQFKKNGRRLRGVIDLIIEDRHHTTVVDWKCHAITETDIRQVRFYQNYLIQTGIPCSRLHGLAVDLIREEIVPIPFRFSIRQTVRLSDSASSSGNAERPSYPSRPSLENCGRCPFASICKDSSVQPPFALTLKEVI
jgi:hypothetical protein